MTSIPERIEDGRPYHARKLWEIALEQLMNGQVDYAMDSLNESIAAHPTAEGYTYRGWARSHKGDYARAIDDCKRAIRLDPEFGNPYNDIGVYLMQLGRLDEAAGWLKRAKQRQRYDSRHFPYLNLGHIYMILGQQNKALDEYIGALELDPDNPVAKKAIAGMDLHF